MPSSGIIWLGTGITIFGIALLTYYAIFGDTWFGTSPISEDDPDYSGTSPPLYAKPIFLVLIPFVGIASVLIGAIVIVFGKLHSSSEVKKAHR